MHADSHARVLRTTSAQFCYRILPRLALVLIIRLSEHYFSQYFLVLIFTALPFRVFALIKSTFLALPLSGLSLRTNLGLPAYLLAVSSLGHLSTIRSQNQLYGKFYKVLLPTEASQEHTPTNAQLSKRGAWSYGRGTWMGKSAELGQAPEWCGKSDRNDCRKVACGACVVF